MVKLKKRPSYPFETIAVAIAFSPRLTAVFAEAIRIQKLTKARLILIHAGKKDQEKERVLNELIKETVTKDQISEIIWKEGNPVNSIFEICKANTVDLLILGAFKKESIFKYYVGSVARNISRRAKCSVLLLTDPVPGGHRLNKIVVNGVDNPKTKHTIATSIYLAKLEGAKEITIVRELHTPVLAMTMADSSTAPEASKIKKGLLKEESHELHSLISEINQKDISIIEKTIVGKPGYAISKYAKSHKADLLVINSPDKNLSILDRIFTHEVEYILEDLPCNLLIVHSRV